MSDRDGWTTSADGTRLFWRRRSPAAAPAAALLVVHGLAEHSGRYEHVLERFAGAGFDCWAPDYRCHGRSPGLRVHVERFEDFDADISAARRLVAGECPRLPLVVVGHSQGGLLALRHAIAEPDGLAGVIVSSPFLGIHPDSRPPAALHLVANVISTFAKRLMFSQVADPALLSHDPQVGADYVADPLVSSSVSARWFTESVRAQNEVLAAAPRLAVPALVMQSGDDRLADPEATRRWAAAAPQHLVEYHEWPGLYHEMFNEPEREQVFEHMERWLKALLGPSVS